MAHELKPNKGKLFINDKKETSSHPDYRGEALVNGREMFIGAWINKAQSGIDYLSLSFKNKNENEAKTEPEAKAASVDNEEIEELKIEINSIKRRLDFIEAFTTVKQPPEPEAEPEANADTPAINSDGLPF